jgi:hypothetical protein
MPLRWLLDSNQWCCDRCRQTFPFNRMAGGARPGRSKTPFIVGGAVVGVGLIAGIVVAASGGGGTKGDAPAPTAPPAAVAPAPAAPAPAAPAPTTPAAPAAPVAPPPTGVDACDQMNQGLMKAKACAAIEYSTQTGIQDMVANSLSHVADGDDNVAPRCAATAAFIEERMREAACSVAERTEAEGYSVAIPAGWLRRAAGGKTGELVVEERYAAVGRTIRTAVELELVTYEEYADASASPEECRKVGELLARRYPSTTLDTAEQTKHRLGRACKIVMHDNDVRRVGWSINVDGKHILRSSCTYAGDLPAPPPGCGAVLDSLTVGDPARARRPRRARRPGRDPAAPAPKPAN